MAFPTYVKSLDVPQLGTNFEWFVVRHKPGQFECILFSVNTHSKTPILQLRYSNLPFCSCTVACTSTSLSDFSEKLFVWIETHVHGILGSCWLQTRPHMTCTEYVNQGSDFFWKILEMQIKMIEIAKVVLVDKYSSQRLFIIQLCLFEICIDI